MNNKDREEVERIIIEKIRNHTEISSSHNEGVGWLLLITIIAIPILLIWAYHSWSVAPYLQSQPTNPSQLEIDCRALAQKLNATFDNIDIYNRPTLTQINAPTNCRICFTKDTNPCINIGGKKACLPGSTTKDCKWYEIE